ncbi:hypothetical protein ANO11243_067160 [Dothideomycetidae sp. 11243]|nr:hypothetical protein ANO11243_067160 [fungal sp. No.11243]
MKVNTYLLIDEPRQFELVKTTHLDDIEKLLENKSVKHSTVYMVVGIKTCFKAKIETQKETSAHKEISGAAPINAVVASSIGGPPPVDVDVEVGIEHGGNHDVQGSFLALDERIFAIEYRLVKWTPPVSLPLDEPVVVLGEVHRPTYSFSGEPVSDDMVQDETSDEDDDDDDISYGDTMTLQLGRKAEGSA